MAHTEGQGLVGQKAEPLIAMDQRFRNACKPCILSPRCAL